MTNSDRDEIERAKAHIRRNQKRQMLNDLIDSINNKDTYASFFYTRIIYSHLCKN